MNNYCIINATLVQRYTHKMKGHNLENAVSKGENVVWKHILGKVKQIPALHKGEKANNTNIQAQSMWESESFSEPLRHCMVGNQ